MKKWIVVALMFFLSACMQAPSDVFSEHLNYGKNIELPVGFIQISDFQKMNDSKHHIENKWPQSPVEVIQTWVEKRLKANKTFGDTLTIIIHQAEVVREKIPSEKWYQKDEIKDTLFYRVEFENSKKHAMVEGHSFIQMPAKTCLAEKEKKWVQMANQMLEKLEKEGLTQLYDEI